MCRSPIQQRPYLLLTASYGGRLLPEAAWPGCSWAVSFRAGGCLAKNLLHHRSASSCNTQCLVLAKSTCKGQQQHTVPAVNDQRPPKPCRPQQQACGTLPVRKAALGQCVSSLRQACLHAAAPPPMQSGGVVLTAAAPQCQTCCPAVSAHLSSSLSCCSIPGCLLAGMACIWEAHS